MTIQVDLLELRRQRNRFGLVAVLVAVGGIAAVLPGNLERRKQLKAANTELLRTQAELASLQRQIVSVQDEIRAVEAIIRELNRPADDRTTHGRCAQ